MGYNSLASCVSDLEKNGHLIRIKEQVDPYLEMAGHSAGLHDGAGLCVQPDHLCAFKLDNQSGFNRTDHNFLLQDFRNGALLRNF